MSFGYWVRRRRKALDLTQEALAKQVGCALGTIKKLESDERRPSKELATRLADLLLIPPQERDTFLNVARAVLAVDQLEIDEQAPEISPVHVPDRQVTNLPAQATPFIGRAKEIAALHELIGRDEVRLITLSGPGGTGKTRLGLQVAARVLDAFEHGVWLVSLASINNLGLVAPTIAQALGVRELGQRPVLELLKDYLREKQTLLLLDNFEHIVDAAPIVGELLASAADLKILVTSRATLRLSDEHEFAVPPLGVPPADMNATQAELAEYEAVRLFVERAQATKSDFTLTDASARAVAEICRRLDGLPLAIRLAAARVKLFSPQALLARLDSRLLILTGGARDLPARQQTIRDTIDWSYNLLDEDEQRLFARLSIFVGGWTIEAVEAMSMLDERPARIEPGEAIGDIHALDALASLLDKSMIRQVEGPDGTPRFTMLETLREYALERLEQWGEGRALRHWHALYFLALAEQAEPELEGPRQIEWLARLERDLDNIRAALRYAIDYQEAEIGLRLAGALALFWYTRSYWSEGRQWYAAALKIGEGASQASRAKALLGAGQLATFQNDYDQAYLFTEQAHALYLALDDPHHAAWALFFQSIAAADQFDTARYEAASAASLALRGAAKDKRGIAYSLFFESETSFYDGDFGRASKLANESLTLFRAVGDIYGISLALAIAAQSAYVAGEYDRARVLGDEGLGINHKLGDRRGAGLTLDILGRIAHAQGEDAIACSLFTEALVLLRDAGDRWAIARCIESIATMSVGAYAVQAARLFGFAEVLRQSIGTPQSLYDRFRCDQAIAATQTTLGAASFGAAWAAGGALTLSQAVEAALAAAGS